MSAPADGEQGFVSRRNPVPFFIEDAGGRLCVKGLAILFRRSSPIRSGRLQSLLQDPAGGRIPS